MGKPQIAIRESSMSVKGMLEHVIIEVPYSMYLFPSRRIEGCTGRLRSKHILLFWLACITRGTANWWNGGLFFRWGSIEPWTWTAIWGPL